jgi:hypothetical protein
MDADELLDRVAQQCEAAGIEFTEEHRKFLRELLFVISLQQRLAERTGEPERADRSFRETALPMQPFPILVAYRSAKYLGRTGCRWLLNGSNATGEFLDWRWTPRVRP